MKKYIWMFFGAALLTVIVYVVIVREEGALKSPKNNHVFNDNDLRIEVIYGSPSKRGRDIFGALVPFDKVWRTGANEATEFHTNKDLDFNGQALKAGDYSVWVLPAKDNWKVYINSVIPEWGVNENGEAARDPQSDVVVMDAAPAVANDVTEAFTITVEKADSTYNMVFNWDKTRVAVPFQSK